jgi:hypothetical protein
MENPTITITRKFTEGATSIKGEPDYYEWREFLTTDEKIRAIKVYLEGGKNQIFYDPYKEEFRKALNRAINNGKLL